VGIRQYAALTVKQEAELFGKTAGILFGVQPAVSSVGGERSDSVDIEVQDAAGRVGSGENGGTFRILAVLGERHRQGP